MSEKKKIVSYVGETLLMGLSFIFLIPPVPSVSGQHYSFVPIGVVAVAMFAGSRLIAAKRGGENIYAALVQVLIFLLFGLVVHERTQV